MAEEARGICVRDVKADQFIEAYAEHLKNSDKFELPVWSDTIKTAVFKELAPYGDDWYYIRAASIARKVYLRPGVGVGMLQKWYGGSYRRGARTEHFRKASAGIIRSVLIQLDCALGAELRFFSIRRSHAIDAACRKLLFYASFLGWKRAL